MDFNNYHINLFIQKTPQKMKNITIILIAIGLISLSVACKKDKCEPEKPTISQDSLQRLINQKKIS